MHPSTDTSLDISTDTRPTLDRYVGRDIYICRSRRHILRYNCRPRVVVRLSADMSIDTLPTFRRYFTETCVLVTVACVADVILPWLVTSAEQRRYPCSTPRFSEVSLYKPGVVNRRFSPSGFSWRVKVETNPIILRINAH